MRLATDLLGEALSEAPSSRPRGDPLPLDEDEEEDKPSSPAEPEPEPPPQRKEGAMEEAEAKKAWESELSLYMETGLVRLGEPALEPT